MDAASKTTAHRGTATMWGAMAALSTLWGPFRERAGVDRPTKSMKTADTNVLTRVSFGPS